MQDDVAVGSALGGGPAGCDVGAVDEGIADGLEPFEGGLFDGVFDENGHHCCHTFRLLSTLP